MNIKVNLLSKIQEGYVILFSPAVVQVVGDLSLYRNIPPGILRLSGKVLVI